MEYEPAWLGRGCSRSKRKSAESSRIRGLPYCPPTMARIGGSARNLHLSVPSCPASWTKMPAKDPADHAPLHVLGPSLYCFPPDSKEQWLCPSPRCCKPHSPPMRNDGEVRSSIFRSHLRPGYPLPGGSHRMINLAFGDAHCDPVDPEVRWISRPRLLPVVDFHPLHRTADSAARARLMPWSHLPERASFSELDSLSGTSLPGPSPRSSKTKSSLF